MIQDFIDFYGKNIANESKLIKKTTEYIDVIKQTKKSNINKDNVNEIMLSQLPSVSIKCIKKCNVKI